jgi:hypothetical protein
MWSCFVRALNEESPKTNINWELSGIQLIVKKKRYLFLNSNNK